MINENNNTNDSIIKDYNRRHQFKTVYKNNLQSSSTFNLIKNKHLELFSSKNELSKSNLYINKYSSNNLHDNINKESSSFKIVENNFIINENNIFNQKLIKNSNYDNIIIANERKKNKDKVKIEENKDIKNDGINKEEINNIDLIINDKFFDLLVNVYQSEGIDLGFNNENGKNLEEQNNKLINNNKIDEIKEQISCICLKSKCLNNYCSCHKIGSICNKNCRCINCQNNI